jgi:hypothetical protein
VRKQLKRKAAQGRAADAEQRAVLDDYALGAVSAQKSDGLTPFDFAAVQASEELDDVAQSLGRLAQKGEL